MNQLIQFHVFTDWPEGTRLPGIVVPQRVYRHDFEFERMPPVQFATNGNIGFRLSDAFNSSFNDLSNARDPISISNATNGRISIRIEWPGYPPWSLQSHTLDNQMQPFSRGRLAHTVARVVATFLEQHQHVVPQPDGGGQRQDWRVTNIPFDRLYLVELRHVSSGSWQPYLCYFAPAAV